MKHVAILNFRYGNFDDSCCYLLREIAAVWKESGVEVTVLHGPTPNVRADLIILHVDLTFVPIDHIAYLRQFPKAINAPVVDISKRFISEHVLRSPDEFQGSVIVKANLNCAGVKEARFAARGLMPKDQAEPFTDYQIFESPSEVPAEYWKNRNIVIEKFLPERDGDQFCLRTWVFFGEKETNSLSYANEPIIKSSKVVRRVSVPDEVPDALRARREELGFDYGKFDYAIVDGEFVLYDANRTPSLGAFSREKYMPTIELLSSGLEGFFR
jgi:hypothetical protein